MADIELVIKIDEVTYKDIKKGKIYTSISDVPLESVVAIANGTPLPKGHGDLIDVTQIAGDGSWDISDRLEQTPTVIEADKVSEDK